MRSLLLLTLLMFTMIGHSSAQSADTTEYLLNNVDVQIESSEALNNMYNFKFAESTKGFRDIQRKYPKHPLPYFLFGLQEYWKYLSNNLNTVYDDSFISYMDSSINLATKMYEQKEGNIEARFFLGAAYGFKGRLYADREKWGKAVGAAKEALHYLPKKGEAPNDYSPEFLFGDGIYNYYTVWIPENYPILKPVMLLFAKGEKGLGISQLTEVANNAFYTRVEAQTYLVDIYFHQEEPNQPRKALPYIKYLAETYPDNPYFQKYYMRISYACGLLSETERIANEIVDKINRKYPFYDSDAARYAYFYLASNQRYRYSNRAKAKEYALLSIKCNEELKKYDSGFYLWSLVYVAQMADEDKDAKTAKIYYEKIKKYAAKDNPAYKEAKAWLAKH